jgi:hypothetical protein
MDIVKNGESSTSPRPNGGEALRSRMDGEAGGMTKLVMPQLDSMFSSTCSVMSKS